MKRVRKKKVTLLVVQDLVKAARLLTDNLSESVWISSQQFVAKCEDQPIQKSLAEYEIASEVRRKRVGIFSDSTRKFL